jgi:pimeloyl-ACP methyl ester carboxylesterase
VLTSLRRSPPAGTLPHESNGGRGVLRVLLIALLTIVVGAIVVLAVGSLLSLDWRRSHRNATAQLPRLAADSSDGLVLIDTTTMRFRARIAGWRNSGPAVVLLHGFPETSAMWTPLLDALAAAGYRALAFDQRGYSPLARPNDVAAYKIDALVSDVLAVADTAGLGDFHLIGHDWGAGVGWATALSHPARLRSFTSLSIPHVAAFAKAIAEDADQRRRSRYMLLFRTPWLPEALFTFNRLALLNRIYAAMSDTQRIEYAAVFAEPGAFSAALNWYRAGDRSAVDTRKVTVPVLFIWGKQDPAVGAAAVAAQHTYIAGPFESHELDAGHWLMEEVPDEVDSIVLAFLGQTERGSR